MGVPKDWRSSVSLLWFGVSKDKWKLNTTQKICRNPNSFHNLSPLFNYTDTIIALISISQGQLFGLLSPFKISPFALHLLPPQKQLFTFSSPISSFPLFQPIMVTLLLYFFLYCEIPSGHFLQSAVPSHLPFLYSHLVGRRFSLWGLLTRNRFRFCRWRFSLFGKISSQKGCSDTGTGCPGVSGGVSVPRGI